MASPAFVVDAQETRDTRYFRVPNEFAENQHAFIPAERALALIIFREASVVKNGKRQTDINGTAKISDQYWHDCTGLEPRMLENAVRGLKAKGLEVTGRGTKAVYRWNWTRWTEAMRSRPNPAAYDPNRKERDAKRAAQNIHPDCATGCAKLRECKPAESGTNTATPFLVTNIAQPVAQTPEQAAEKRWAKTLAAMRADFASVGLDLLMKLLAVVWAIAGCEDVSDYILAESVKAAYVESRGRWHSAILLLTHVPNVLKGWKAKGQPMDDTGDDDAPRPAMHRPEKPKPKRARDLI
jgi:hypothetical protein